MQPPSLSFPTPKVKVTKYQCCIQKGVVGVALSGLVLIVNLSAWRLAQQGHRIDSIHPDELPFLGGPRLTVLTADIVLVGIVHLLHPPVAEGQLPHPVHAAVHARAQAQVGSWG